MAVQENFWNGWKAPGTRVLAKMKFFRGILRGCERCYLSEVLRHAGAFGNKVVRILEQV
jgi:hypothetical protein